MTRKHGFVRARRLTEAIMHNIRQNDRHARLHRTLLREPVRKLESSTESSASPIVRLTTESEHTIGSSGGSIGGVQDASSAFPPQSLMRIGHHDGPLTRGYCRFVDRSSIGLHHMHPNRDRPCGLASKTSRTVSAGPAERPRAPGRQALRGEMSIRRRELVVSVRSKEAEYLPADAGRFMIHEKLGNGANVGSGAHLPQARL